MNIHTRYVEFGVSESRRINDWLSKNGNRVISTHTAGLAIIFLYDDNPSWDNEKQEEDRGEDWSPISNHST